MITTNIKKRQFLLGLLIILSFGGYSQTSEILPASAIIDWRSAGVPGEIPEYPEQYNIVTDFGAVGDGVTDNTDIFREAINATTPGHILFIPEGTFLVRSTITINKGIVIRGAGPSKTLILSQHDNNTFWIRGNGSVEMTTFAAQASSGSSEFQVTSAQGIFAGDLLFLERQDGGEQIAEVEQVNANLITLSGVLYGDYTDESKVSRFEDLVEGFGIEDLKIRIERPEGGSNGTTKIRLSGVSRCWVKNIETEGYSYEVQLNGCFQCEVRDSYFHYTVEEILARTTGFGAYGVMVVNGTSESLVENNVFHNYRHAMPTTDIIGGNVFGYNMSSGMWDGVPMQRSAIIGDMELHHGFGESILIEGNCVEYIRFDGAAGYLKNWNTVLRNRTTLTGINGWSDTGINYIIGNELPPVKMVLGGANNGIGAGMSASVLHGNYVNYNNEGISWDPSISNHNIPNSYYLSEKPEWFGDLDWPCYGGDLMPGNTRRSPAEVRFWTILYPEEAPSGLSASKNDTEVKLTWTNNSTNQVDFIICRSVNGRNYKRIATVSETSYTDNVPVDGQYHYYVRALNYLGGENGGEAGGESDPSNIVTVGEGILSVEQGDLTNTISVFPNPANDVMNFNLSDNQAQTVSIYSGLGKLVKEEKYTDNSVNISGLEKGMYFLVIKGIQKNYHAKFIIE